MRYDEATHRSLQKRKNRNSDSKAIAVKEI